MSGSAAHHIYRSRPELNPAECGSWDAFSSQLRPSDLLGFSAMAGTPVPSSWPVWEWEGIMLMERRCKCYPTLFYGRVELSVLSFPPFINKTYGYITLLLTIYSFLGYFDIKDKKSKMELASAIYFKV
jgi:hypothetical protein